MQHVHSEWVGRRFGRPAGHSGEIRIREWTHSSQQCSLVIPISCVGACFSDGMQGGDEMVSVLLKKAGFCSPQGHYHLLPRK